MYPSETNKKETFLQLRILQSEIISIPKKPTDFGLCQVNKEYLQQYLLFLMGSLLEIFNDPLRACKYYSQSIKWRGLRHLDNSLMKRALKRLHVLSDLQVEPLLNKFYIKTRSIYVIMELSNETAQIH